VAFAKTLLGTPYHPGGCKLEAPGFDCSGLVHFSYAQFGIRLGRSSRDQALDGHAVPVQEVLPGDLLLFARKPDGRIFHAGLATSRGSDSLRMIHATQRLGVHETNITGMVYWREKLVDVRRISR
jgi:cell wall-associated NlpC family hydrolase